MYEIKVKCIKVGFLHGPSRDRSRTPRLRSVEVLDYSCQRGVRYHHQKPSSEENFKWSVISAILRSTKRYVVKKVIRGRRKESDSGNIR